jgi:type IV pilus assembly protein PilN
MIRINLLAGPRERKPKSQYDVRAQAFFGIGVLVVTIAGCWWYSATLDEELEARQVERSEKTARVAALNEQVKQVANFEQRKKLLEDKNRIIDQLEKARVGPVKVLDHVSQSLDPLKLWLVRVSINGQDIDLEGRALTNDDVVEFVNNLRRTDYFMNINLHESRSVQESQVGVYSFKLGFRLKG